MSIDDNLLIVFQYDNRISRSIDTFKSDKTYMFITSILSDLRQ